MVQEKIELHFQEDSYYNGELAYKKGKHMVEVAGGWADRWIKRGAIPPNQIKINIDKTVELPADKDPAPVQTEPSVSAEEPVETVKEESKSASGKKSRK